MCVFISIISILKNWLKKKVYALQFDILTEKNIVLDTDSKLEMVVIQHNSKMNGSVYTDTLVFVHDSVVYDLDYSINIQTDRTFSKSVSLGQSAQPFNVKSVIFGDTVDTSILGDHATVISSRTGVAPKDPSGFTQINERSDLKSKTFRNGNAFIVKSGSHGLIGSSGENTIVIPFLVSKHHVKAYPDYVDDFDMGPMISDLKTQKETFSTFAHNDFIFIYNGNFINENSHLLGFKLNKSYAIHTDIDDTYAIYIYSGATNDRYVLYNKKLAKAVYIIESNRDYQASIVGIEKLANGKYLILSEGKNISTLFFNLEKEALFLLQYDKRRFGKRIHMVETNNRIQCIDFTVLFDEEQNEYAIRKG